MEQTADVPAACMRTMHGGLHAPMHARTSVMPWRRIRMGGDSERNIHFSIDRGGTFTDVHAEVCSPDIHSLRPSSSNPTD